MPVPWLPVALPEAMELARRPVYQQQTQTKFGNDELIVTSESSVFDPVADRYTFERGVVARYGPTTVRCDRLVVDRGAKKAMANGNVTVQDPEADLAVTDLEFSWDAAQRNGHATHVQAMVGNVKITASEVTITPDKYTFLNVAGTSCRERTPFYELRTPRLVITPGRIGRAERPRLYLLGNRILTLPSRSFELDPRTEGFMLPTPTRKQDGRKGISWSSGFMLNDRTNLNMNYASFERTRVTFGAIATRSFVPAAKSEEILTPASEFQERFGYGYFDNIRIATPERERQRLGANRKSISLATAFNQVPTARGDGTAYSKPLEVVGAIGGTSAEGAYLGQVRLQSVRRGNEALDGRVALSGAYLLPEYSLGKDLYTAIRLDTNVFAGSNPYGWARTQLGVTYRPHPIITLGAAGFLTGDLGTPQFPGFDTPYARNGYALRADINLGATRLSVLQKYDSRLGVFDKEYTFSQVVGCFEPFVLYRRYPNEYVVGMRLRLDPFYHALRQRSFKRSKTATK